MVQCSREHSGTVGIAKRMAGSNTGFAVETLDLTLISTFSVFHSTGMNIGTCLADAANSA